MGNFRISDSWRVWHLFFVRKLKCKTKNISNFAFAKQPCQLMSALRRAGLLSSVKGRPSPSLAKAPSAITLLDIYKAVEGEKPLLHLDTHTNPECGVGIYIQLALQDYFDRVQRTAEDEMRRITLKDILDRYHEKVFRSGRKAF